MMNRKYLNQKKSAFTLLELVIVIVVLGILAALGMPRLDRDLKQDAADNILSAIRYTQHLAINDNKHQFNDPEWQRRFWRIVFGTCTGTDHFYMIGSDDDKDGSDNAYFEQTEAALDPINGKPMFWINGNDCSSGGDGSVSEEIFISKKFGITTIAPSGGCGASHIAFDHLGRPFHGTGFSQSAGFTTADPSFSGYMNQTCTLKFTMSDGDTFSIDIVPETGYAQIVGQSGS